MDRNFGVAIVVTSCVKSLSARRAWIEMFLALGLSWCIRVALRKESVDRNIVFDLFRNKFLVALRKESVDRNRGNIRGRYVCCRVALRKESVDRNVSKALQVFFYA